MKTTLLLFISALIFCFASNAQQLENGGFESWELITEINLEEPVDWSSIKTSDGGTIVNNSAPQVWEKSTDAHSGSFSVKLTNKTTFGIVVTSTLTNGRVHASLTNPLDGFTYADTSDARWNTVINGRPDSLVGWYKAQPSGADNPAIKVILHNGYAKIPDTVMPAPYWIGFIIHDLPNATVNTWTRFSIPFTYLSPAVPEYIFILLNGDDGVNPTDGTVAYFDDLELIYNPAGIEDNLADNYNFFISDNILFLQNISYDIMNNAEIEILDITGKLVWKSKVNSNAMKLDGFSSQQGIYIVRLLTNNKSISRKVYIH